MRTSTSRSLSSAVAIVATSVLVAALIVGVHAAAADIRIESISRTSGVAAQWVDLLIACGGCGPRTLLPVSLLPASDSPERHPCRGTSCATRAPTPPASPPYVPLGTAAPLDGGARLARRLGLAIPASVRRRGPRAIRDYVASGNRLRFRIPDADPGLYTYVIFCCGLAPPEGGTLIGHPQRRGDREETRLANVLDHGEFLRIEGGEPAADEGLPGWAVWGAVGLLALLTILTVWRRRATPSV